MMDQDSWQTVHIYMYAATTGCGTLCQVDAYHHAVFPQQVLEEGRPICELKALNAAVAIKLGLPPWLAGRWS